MFSQIADKQGNEVGILNNQAFSLLLELCTLVSSGLFSLEIKSLMIQLVFWQRT